MFIFDADRHRENRKRRRNSQSCRRRPPPPDYPSLAPQPPPPSRPQFKLLFRLLPPSNAQQRLSQSPPPHPAHRPPLLHSLPPRHPPFPPPQDRHPPFPGLGRRFPDRGRRCHDLDRLLVEVALLNLSPLPRLHGYRPHLVHCGRQLLCRLMRANGERSGIEKTAAISMAEHLLPMAKWHLSHLIRHRRLAADLSSTQKRVRARSILGR